MTLNDFEITVDGVPIKKVTSDRLEVQMGTNERKRLHREAAKRKRKMRGSITFELPKETPWHKKILIKEQ